MDACTNPQKQYLYSSWADICKYHGIIVFAGYILFKILGVASLTILLLWLVRKHAFLAEQCLRKSKPWVQDIIVLLLLCLTIVVVYAGWSQSVSWREWAWYGAWYILFDMFVYHSRILWFDDLRPKRSLRANIVRSHRRILFQALVNFTESIFLFTVIYRSCIKCPTGFWELLQHSLMIATTLGAPKALRIAQLGFN